METKTRVQWVTACAVVLAVACCVLAQAQDAAAQRLLSGDREVRDQAVRDLLDQRARLVAQLLTMIDEEEDWTDRSAQAKAAAYVLGEMRAVEAVPTLVRFINYERVGLPMSPSPQAPVYSTELWMVPAVEALVKIGEPCIGHVMNRLRGETGDAPGPADLYCLRVLVELKGVEPTAALLVAAITSEDDPGRRERLTLALQLLLEQSAAYAEARAYPWKDYNPYAEVH